MSPIILFIKRENKMSHPFQSTLDRISKAKIKLMLKGSEAFLSTLILSLDTKVEEGVGTASTDGIQINFDPAFVATLSDDQLIFLLAHETWHVAFMHMCRLGTRSAQRWNSAADYVINLMLVNSGYTFIEGGLLNKKYTGMSADEVYDLLPEDDSKLEDNILDGDIQEAGKGDSGSSGEGGEPTPGEGGASEMTSEEVEQKIQDSIIKAATAAQMANQSGSIPGSIAKLIDQMLNPVLPWQVILANYMSTKSKAEKSWSRRNKRFRTTYLPSRLSESMGDVNIYVDASGSVSTEEFTAYISEMHDIRESLKPEMMKVISFDTSLKEEFVMEKGEEMAVSFSGGGGTSIGPVIAHAEQQDEVDVTIIFTDGYFGNVDYSDVPNDILFVIVNNPSWTCDAPNATVIHMDYKG
jgi:predicted metal-dependent peptidase